MRKDDRNFGTDRTSVRWRDGSGPSESDRQQFERNSRRLRERARDKSVIHTTAVCKIYGRQSTLGAITDLTASVAIRVLSRTACAISSFPAAFVRSSNSREFGANYFDKECIEKECINRFSLIQNIEIKRES